MKCGFKIGAGSGVRVEMSSKSEMKAECLADLSCQSSPRAGAGSETGRQMTDFPQTESILGKAESDGEGVKSNCVEAEFCYLPNGLVERLVKLLEL